MLFLHVLRVSMSVLFFFFNDTATTEIYTLSLHDALPISHRHERLLRRALHGDHQGAAHRRHRVLQLRRALGPGAEVRSEEHTSELQSQSNLVCRLLLEKKKKQTKPQYQYSHDSALRLISC